MVLAYLIRKEYEADLAAALLSQRSLSEMTYYQSEIARHQSEMIRHQSELIGYQAEIVRMLLDDCIRRAEARAEKDAVIARQEERIRQLEELLDSRNNGNGNGNGHNGNDTTSES